MVILIAIVMMTKIAVNKVSVKRAGLEGRLETMRERAGATRAGSPGSFINIVIIICQFWQSS